MGIFDTITNPIADAAQKASDSVNAVIDKTKASINSINPLASVNDNIVVNPPEDKVIVGETVVHPTPTPIAVDPIPDKVITSITKDHTQAPIVVEEPPETAVQTTKQFDEFGQVASSTSEKKVGGQVVEKKFTLNDPLTGQVQDFDDIGKFNKAKADLAKKTEEKKQVDEVAGISGDIFTDALTNLAKAIDPNTPDPIAEAAFNWQIQKLNPTFQAQNAALKLKLKQAGVNPNAPGAGLSLMNQMARQQGATVADVIGALNVQSQHRMVELSKWGIDKAMDIQEFQLQRERDKYDFGIQKIGFLANTIKSDNPDDYAQLLSQAGFSGVDPTQFMKDITSNNEEDKQAAIRSLSNDHAQVRNYVNGLAPGVSFDVTSYGGLEPAQLGDVGDRLADIQSDIQRGKPEDIEAAREKLLQLQELYPDVFDGDYEKWDPNDLSTLGNFTRKNEVLAGSLELLTRGDDDGAVDLAVSSGLIDPKTADVKFDKLWNTQNDRDQRLTLELAGLTEEPMTQEEKIRYLAASEVKGLKDTTNVVGQAVDQYLENGSPEFKEWYQQPGNADDFNTFINNMLSGNVMRINENGQFEVDNRQVLDPTNPASIIAHKFMDWPYAIDGEGNFVDPSEWGSNENVYAGNNPITDESFSDTAGGVAYQEKMDKAWEAYVSRGGERTRQEWYVDSKGGLDLDVPIVPKKDEGTDPGDLRDKIVKTTMEKVQALVAGEDFTGESFDTNNLLEIEKNPDLFNQVRDAKNSAGQSVFFDMPKTFGDDEMYTQNDFEATGLKADVVKVQNDKNKTSTKDTGVGAGKGTIVMHDGSFYRVTEFISDYLPGGIFTGNKREGVLTLTPLSGGAPIKIKSGKRSSATKDDSDPDRVEAGNVKQPTEGEKDFVGPPSPKDV